jgi:hypothetical protein
MPTIFTGQVWVDNGVRIFCKFFGGNHSHAILSLLHAIE